MTEPTISGDDCSPGSTKFPWRKLILFAGILIGTAIFIIKMIWLAFSTGGGTAASNAWWILIPMVLFIAFVGSIISIILRSQKGKRKDHIADSALKKDEKRPATPATPTLPWYTKVKWGKIVFWTIGFILGTIIVHWIFFGGGKNKFFSAPRPASIHSDFVPRRPCDVIRTVSYANKDLTATHNTYKIKLVEGCYADFYINPGYFDQYETVLSHNPGDYVSLWCNGNPNPYPILESTDDVQGILKREMYGCYGHNPNGVAQWTNEFHFQGHGTITITATSTRVSKPIGDDGYPAL